jgi:hypothetical protein
MRLEQIVNMMAKISKVVTLKQLKTSKYASELTKPSIKDICTSFSVHLEKCFGESIYIVNQH